VPHMNANTSWEVEIASDVYDAGVSEDGEMMEGLSFYLVATASNGRRFVHFMRFNSPSRGWLERTRTAVGTLFAKVLIAQEAGTWFGPVGRAAWEEVDPAYGSEAYCANWRAIEADRKELENR